MYTIVLLGFFAFGVLMAWFLTLRRGQVNLSGTVTLRHTGLSVPVPSGSGWKGEDTWQISQGGRLELTAQLQTAGEADAVVIWGYELAGESDNPAAAVEQLAAKQGGEVRSKGTFAAGDGMKLDYVLFTIEGAGFEGASGMADLGGGRMLSLEVVSSASGPQAEAFMQKLFTEVQYEPSDLVDKGADFLEMARSAGAEALFLRGMGEANGWFYELYDGSDRLKGYSMTRFKPDSEPFLVYTDYYERFGPRQVQASREVLRTNDTFTDFEWISQRAGSRRGQTKITRTEDGLMLVEDGGEQALMWPSDASVPDPFFDGLAGFLAELEPEPLILDFLLGDGLIFPVYVYIEDAEQETFFGEPVAGEVVFELIHLPGRSLRVFFDGEGRISGKMDDIGGDRRVWKVSSLAQIEKNFHSVRSLDSGGVRE